MYKKKVIYIAGFIIVLLSLLVYARSFTPYGDIDMLDLLGIYNVTEITIKNAPTDDTHVPNKAYVDSVVNGDLMRPPAHDFVMYNHSGGRVVNITYKSEGTVVAYTLFTYATPSNEKILHVNMTVGTDVYVATYAYYANGEPLSVTITTQ